MSQSIGAVQLDLGINQKSFQKQMKGLEKTTKKTFQTFSVAIGNMVANGVQRAISGLGNFITSSLEAGSDVAELANVVETVFPSMSSEVESFAKTSLEQYGLIEKEAKNFMGTYGAMAKSFGYTEQEALKMAKAITGLTGDVSSFYNKSNAESYTKMKAIFTGETESLKELGVVMTEAALNEFALQKGMTKTVNKMTEQEKVALRMQFIMEKLSHTQGDFAKTSNSWANQTRILTGQWESFKTALGQGLINILTPAIQWLNVFMKKLIQLGEVFSAFTAKLMGKSSSGGSKGGVMGEVATAVGDANDAAGGMAANTAETAKAAKDAKKSLMGFDELNVLQKPAESADSGASAGGLNLDSLSLSSDATVDESSIADSPAMAKLREILAKFAQIDFTPLKESLQNLKDSFAPIVSTIGNGLLWVLENVLQPLAEWTIEDFIPSFLNLLAGAFTVLNPLLESLGRIFQPVWEKFFLPIAQWTGGVIVSVLESLGTVLTNIGNWMSEHPAIVDAITVSIISFFAAWKLTELMAFVQMSGGIVSALASITAAIKAGTVAKVVDKAETIYLTALYAKDFVVSLASSAAAFVKNTASIVASTAAKVADTIATTAATVATTAWNVCAGIASAVTTALGAAFTFLTSPIGLVIVAITALIAIGVLLYKNWDEISAWCKETWAKIKSAISEAVTKAKEIVIEVFDTIKGVIEKVVNGVKDFISSAFDFIKKIFETYVNAWKTVITTVFDAIKKAIEWYIETWKTIITTAFNFIKDTISDVVNGVSDVISRVFGTIRTTVSSIVDGIKNAVTSAFDTIKTKVSGVATSVKDAVINAFDGMKNTLKSIINGILGFIEGMVNGVINGINKMIGALNNIKVTIPDWVPGYGGKTFGLNLQKLSTISLPRLAEGGFVRANQPRVAVIGDNKTQGEIVSPEDKMYEISRKAILDVLREFKAGTTTPTQAQTQMAQIIVKLGEETLVNKIIKLINDESRRVGTSVIKV